MINRDDENILRKMYTEMNIGFMVPQNGGVPSQSVAILGQSESPELEEEKGKDVSQIITSVIDDLNHLKMDVDQGCRGDAQIDQLQKCCDLLAQAVEQLGNTSSSQYQNGAFTGAISSDNRGDGGEAAVDMTM